jgi:hypothetical protein
VQAKKEAEEASAREMAAEKQVFPVDCTTRVASDISWLT